MDFDVFISYSRKDMAVADRICSAFDKAGITYFIDRQGIGGGMEFPEILADAILGCNIFLFLASENSYQSKFTNSEVTFAFNEKEKNHIMPYIIDGSELPRMLRFVFSGINWRNIEDHPVETVLVGDILKMLGREPKAAPAPKPAVTSVGGTKKTAVAGGMAAASATPKPAPVSAPVKPAPAPTPKPAEAEISAAEAFSRGLKADKAKNHTEAVKWYGKAAEQGHAGAQCNLGVCYKNGEGVAQSWEEAVKWYRKAAEQGNAAAQHNLGVRYANGGGVAQSWEEAVKWYRKAAEQGHAGAQCNLGACYANGEGVAQSWEEAVKWYRKAAEQGNVAAQYNLGRCYEVGKGVVKNYEEAVKWYRKAAEQGDKDATKKVAAIEEAEKTCKLYEEADKRTAQGIYAVGDYYDRDGRRGVVFEVTKDGRHGKIVSVDQTICQWATNKKYGGGFMGFGGTIPSDTRIGASSTDDGAENHKIVESIDSWQEKYPVFAWCRSLGDGWYLPAIDELEKILSDKKTCEAINHTLQFRKLQTLPLGEQSYCWASTEYEENSFCAYYVAYGTQTGGRSKYSNSCVRAVCRF